MKQISLPIGLLGRIAPLALKPSREELLKEVSTPITILDLMSSDQWIKEAFEKANAVSNKANSVAHTIRKFLDDNTPDILDKWSEMVGRDKALWFAKILSENEELTNLVETLSECFTVSGYLLAKMEDNQ